jgi:NAD(P)H dehydrogenase (quinone)
VFLMNPPNYDPEPGFPDTHAVAKSMAQALSVARPGRAVLRSKIGAHVATFNLLNNAGIVEAALPGSETPVALLRPAWFMENAGGDVEAARDGTIQSYLQPLDHAIAMVSTQDIGRAAAGLLNECWTGTRVVELEGPRRYSAHDIASAFALVLNRRVEAHPVARRDWERVFRSQGMRHPEARIRMLDGFNEGWLDFQGEPAERQVGTVTLEVVVGRLVAGQEANHAA